MNKEQKSLNRVGKLTGSMLNLANKGAKKIENYANKSVEENKSEKAKKLAGLMNKFSKNIEENHDEYVAKVEAFADELVNLSKKVVDKAKSVYGEMKQRVEVAREKAKQDTVAKDDVPADDGKAKKKEKKAKGAGEAAEEKTEVAEKVETEEKTEADEKVEA